MKKDKKYGFKTAILPVGTLLLLIILGLLVFPQVFKIEPVPLEIIFILAGTVAITQLFYLGFKWEEISESIVSKLAKAMPTLLILLAIGLIIGSWIACGTIPMLVYYGIKLIHPDFIYLIAFIVPV
ncbi:MAG: sodium:proton antiporter, partial [Crocinitomicaceae bacterium]|nr:sodium:proton antiporter [Crocinitomicaceae bacterium]